MKAGSRPQYYRIRRMVQMVRDRAMRRDVGCDERDAGLVEGRQGHDPGSTIGADDMRPLIEMRAAMRG
jgi:hypothetical protein